MVQQEEIYIGIDLSNTWTQISYFVSGMKGPETVSLVAGEERYRIPTALYKRHPSGSWHLPGVGWEEQKDAESIYVDGLWERSLQSEVVWEPHKCEAEELFLLFLRKVLRLIPIHLDFSRILALTFHLPRICPEAVELLKRVTAGIGIKEECVFIQDDRESFCHFAMHQEKELMVHDVALFVCEGNELLCYYLKKEDKTRPRKVEIEIMELGSLPLEPKRRDEAFGGIVQEVFQGKIVSAVYLMGDGLEGDWLKESVQILCRGRRAFQGKNLYTRGACYGSYEQVHKGDSDYIYFSEYKLANNISIQVRNGERQFFLELAEAGLGCYEVKKSCQVLLEKDASIDVWLQPPDSGQARIESLQLTGLPERPPKATRLLIEALPAGKRQILIRVTDLGFGPWYAASGKVWEYCIDE